MQDPYNKLILPDLQLMLAEDDSRGLSEFSDVLHAAAIASILEELPEADTWRVLKHCTVERQVEVFQFFSMPRQVELVESLDRDPLTRLLEDMAPDDRVDLLSRMPQDRVDSLLPLMAQVERNDIRRLLSYPEDCAGSIMTTEYASLPDSITVREAIEQLRNQAPDRETIYYVYILTRDRRLDGFISLRDLILAKPESILADICRRDVVSVRVDEDQEDVAQTLARFDFIAIPVVDDQHRLVGIVTHDDAIDIVQEEATEDAYRQGAVEPLEDGYLDTPLATLAWKRGIWLMLLAVVAIATAWVIRYYENANSSNDGFKFMIAFLPLVLASGGNAGSQSATLVIRMLALDQLSNAHAKMARREIILGFALGLAVAATGFMATRFGFGYSASKAVVVAATVLMVVILGTLSGAALPVILDRIGVDPALMSNPLIAAIVDVVGVVIYYRVAMYMLGSS